MTADQVAFLARNNVTKYDVFDATGLKKKQYQTQMKREGKILAVGVTPCDREGHSMRTAYGHCAMCDPKKIRFQERFREDAFVYVASPQSNNQVVKIGFAKNVQGRASSLSNENYGGYSDWVIIDYVHSANAGRLENQAHTHFKENRLEATYFKDGAIQDARELFNCTPSVALDFILKFSANEASSSKFVQDKPTVKRAKITKKSAKKQSEMTKKGDVSFQQCASCGNGKMVKRYSRSGGDFLGCSRFPQCRYTENVSQSKPADPDKKPSNTRRTEEAAIPTNTKNSQPSIRKKVNRTDTNNQSAIDNGSWSLPSWAWLLIFFGIIKLVSLLIKIG